MTKKVAIAASMIMLGSLSTASERDAALAGFFAGSLTIQTTEGIGHEFTTYLAITPQQRAHGLMFVTKLPDDFGMLFIYDEARVTSMWMKNTVLPLDMLFIRSDGTISSIARDTVPGSLASILSDEAVTAVLELNAGTSERLKLAPGDKVIYGPLIQRLTPKNRQPAPNIK